MPRVLTAPPRTPAEMFTQCAVPVAWSGEAMPRRMKRSADWLSDADEIGADIVAAPRADGLTWYSWRWRGHVSAPIHQRPSDAARAAAITAGLPCRVAAVRVFSVQPWLAEALEQRGEIIRSRTDGRKLWGCTERNFDPDNSPVICDVFGSRCN